MCILADPSLKLLSLFALEAISRFCVNLGLIADTGTMAEAEKIRVCGHNNATYGPVPKDEQLFSVEFLEIAPTPITA